MNELDLIMTVAKDGLENDKSLLHLCNELANTVKALTEHVVRLNREVRDHQMLLEQLQDNTDSLRDKVN